MTNYQTLLYYKFTPLANPEAIMTQHQVICQECNLKGRVLISKEGINGTVEGSVEDTNKYMDIMDNSTDFSDITFKKQPSNGESFTKMIIKVRDEIVTTGLPYHEELGPLVGLTGKYISAEELHDLIHSDIEFYIIDMRNDYEFKLGHFQDSIMPQAFTNFRDLPNIIPEIKHLKDKKIVTVCTGGIRCEKASGFLMYHGFTDVSQLQDGIVTYMEKYPNQDFLGKLYVFDKRMAIGFNTNSPEYQTVGKCDLCGAPSENIIDYFDDAGVRHHGIVCQNCLDTRNIIFD
jgi:UPF0176 protein